MSSQTRALELGRQLGVCAVIDATGRLGSEVELVCKRRDGGAISPVMVRVGSEARDDELVADAGVVGRCRRYNDALERLRQLGLRLAAAMDAHPIELTAGSTIAYAHRELTRLDALISERQATCMGQGTVRLGLLVIESEFFEEHHASLEPIVVAAEQGLISPWDGNTQELTFDD